MHGFFHCAIRRCAFTTQLPHMTSLATGHSAIPTSRAHMLYL
jgi:hypothetical protein